MADSPENKAAAKKAPAKKSAAKKTPAKKAPAAKKAAAAKAPATTAPVRKAAPDGCCAAARPSPRRARLGGWDFATWRMATDDPVMRSTILGVLVLDKSPDWDQLYDRYERASRLAPVLRSKVVEGPTDLQTPRVVVDPNFDLSFHMRRFRMPEGSTWNDVLEDARRAEHGRFRQGPPAVAGDRCSRACRAASRRWSRSCTTPSPTARVPCSWGWRCWTSPSEGADLGPMPPEPEPVVLDTKGFMQAVVRNNVGWVARTAEDAIKGIRAAGDVGHQDTRGRRSARSATPPESLARFTKVPPSRCRQSCRGRSINYHFDTIELDFGQVPRRGQET